MKFSNITDTKTDLSDMPSILVVRTLMKGDVVVYDGEEWRIEFPPKKSRKGVWLVGIGNTKEHKYIKIIENIKPKMTKHEKKTMVNNIEGVVKLFEGEDDRLISIIKNYYNNLSNHNNYDDTDVRECMGKFPIELLKKSGVVV